MGINASLPIAAAAGNGGKNTASAGNDLATQIKNVIAKIAEVTQKLKDGIDLSKEQRKNIQAQLTLLQQQLAELLRRQAQQAQQKHDGKSNVVENADQIKAQDSNIDIYI
ncbi:FlxA-like family protein [Yersinia intermedia]|uniref:FlxA-like family protein n=1 Tax=Yersinia intermedia TaxID=631 RepID=UPI0022FEE687|nr:FlxA-like family protein [Yersinia intermedia]MDA5482449.1 FlxA-like family protein [Yersinia intermedia]